MTYAFAYRGHCRECGDYWQEDEPSVVCPECGSLDIEDAADHP